MQVLFFAIFLIGLTPTSAFAELKALPMRDDQLPGTWVGHGPCGVEFVNITFETNFSGWFVYSFIDEPSVAVKILKWKIQDHTIICDYQPHELQKEKVSIRITGAQGCGITCHFQWGDYKQTFKLLQEKEIIRRIQQTKRAVNRAKAGEGIKKMEIKQQR